jgi:hypothetical protein
MVVRGSRSAGVIMWAVLLCVAAAAYVRPERLPDPPFGESTVVSPSMGPKIDAPDDYRFSNGYSGTQGTNQWSYEQWDGTKYSPMTWDATNKQWHGSCEFCTITREWLYPDVNDAVIAWTAPKAGTVTVQGMMDHDSYNGSADGVRTMIRKASGKQLTKVWPSAEYQIITPGLTAQHLFTTDVVRGDTLYFHVNRAGTTAYDRLWWDPHITYNKPPAFTLDQADLVMSPTDFDRVGISPALDASLATVPQGSTMDFYHSAADEIQKFNGTLDHPAQSSIYHGPGHFTNPHNLPGEWWIPNIYRTSTGGLLAFAHIEKADPATTGWWAIGLAYSTDQGNTFTKLGYIVTHEVHDTGPNINIGGVPYVIKDGYFYIYYDEKAEHVARAPVADVLAAAEQGNVSDWRKYFNGGWAEPGLSGRASPILPARPITAYLTHGDAAYSTYLDKFLLISYNQDVGKGIYFAMSKDPTKYDEPAWIQYNRSGKDSLSPYETIVNVDGTDNGVVGQEFYVYFGYRPQAAVDERSEYPSQLRWLYRQKVTLHRTG